MSMAGDQWFVTIVVAAITSGGTYLAAKAQGKASVDSVYVDEMRKIIEDYKKEREALKAEKEKLQKLVEKVQKINRELEEDNRLLKEENHQLRNKISILKEEKK